MGARPKNRMVPTSYKAKVQSKNGDQESVLSAEISLTPSTSTIRECNGNNTILPLNYGLALHRLFTFPLDFLKKYCDPRVPAELGLFYNEKRALLCCNFCEFSISPEKFVASPESEKKMIKEMQENWNCKIDAPDSKNVPMGNVDSVLNYKFEAHRLYSLLKKNDWSHVKPVDLARSGFYYTGDSDNVRCAFCNLEVRGWEKGDTPDGEHKKWNPKCPLLCEQSIAINIAIGSEQIVGQHEGIARTKIGINPFVVPEVLKKYGGNISFVKKSNVFLVTPQDLNIHEWSPPLNSNFATLNSRLESFKDYWPRGLSQKPLELARAGFFYTGSGDRTICFHCNLGLKDWSPNDDPFTQHCVWNPSCQYMLMCKDPNFVGEVLHRNQNTRNCKPRSIRGHGNGDMACLKCRTDIVSKVNLPCGHMTHCSECSDNHCAVCTQEIVAQIKVPGFSAC
ncbi:baculoviral IAP repeat-containing protein 7-B-like [Cloeon dipterum]|uniref:baculoviral IAP repeat-containing protein 7-B-like n=1 Tax=Cloeon dipterum TaxID=197152 RepID=UPI0032207344